MNATPTPQPLIESTPQPAPLAHPRFSGRTRTAAHVLWWFLLVALLVMMVVAIAPNLEAYTKLCDTYYCPGAQLSAVQMQALLAQGGSPFGYALYTVGLNLLVSLAYLIVAVVIFLRRGEDGVAYLVSITLLTFGGATQFLDVLSSTIPVWGIPISALQYVGSVLLMCFFYVFPNGRLVPRWARWLLVGWGIEQLLEYINPALKLDWLSAISNLTFFVLLGAALLAQVYRYRRVSTGVERRQTKWVVLGVAGMVISFLVFYVVFVVQPELQNNIYVLLTSQTLLYLALMGLPVSIGIAILRSRLWNIDFLLNRTLVYGILTAILAGVLAVSSDLTKRVFLALTGGTSELAPIFATLIVVALFDPIKKQIQSFVDRHVKYATGTLGAFGEELTKFVALNDPDTLTIRFLSETLTTFGATGGAIYLGQGTQLHLKHSAGKWDGHAALAIPLEYAGKHIGMVALGARTNGDEYDQTDRARLQQMSSLVAHALELITPVHHEPVSIQSPS